MKHGPLLRRYRLIALVLLWIAAVPPDAQGERLPSGDPRQLRGTFLQLTEGHGAWDREQWRQLIGYFEALGLEELVIQWTLLDDVAFYESTALPAATATPLPNPPLHTILELADEANLQVRLGLAASSTYWNALAAAPELVEVSLARLYLRSMAVAREVAVLAAAHPSFRGWYITEEIDDVSWVQAERQDTIIKYLSALSTQLKELTPGATVSVSGFSNAFLDPSALGEFWGRLLDNAPIDTVLFQDGVGVGKLEPRTLPLYLEAVRAATAAKSRTFQVVVELFRQHNGPPFNEQQFEANPAPFDDVLAQLELAAEFADGGLLGFSVPEYMSPLGGDQARDRYGAYLRYFGK